MAPLLGLTEAGVDHLQDLQLVHTGQEVDHLRGQEVGHPLVHTGQEVAPLQVHTEVDLQLVPTEAGVDHPQGHQVVHTGQEVGHLPAHTDVDLQLVHTSQEVALLQDLIGQEVGHLPVHTGQEVDHLQGHTEVGQDPGVVLHVHTEAEADLGPDRDLAVEADLGREVGAGVDPGLGPAGVDPGPDPDPEAGPGPGRTGVAADPGVGPGAGAGHVVGPGRAAEASAGRAVAADLRPAAKAPKQVQVIPSCLRKSALVLSWVYESAVIVPVQNPIYGSTIGKSGGEGKTDPHPLPIQYCQTVTPVCSSAFTLTRSTLVPLTTISRKISLTFYGGHFFLSGGKGSDDDSDKE